MPVSPNPDDMTTQPLTPISAASATASTAAWPGTAIRATSGTTGESRRLGTVVIPCTSGRFGLTGTTVPAYPNSRM